MADEKPLTKSDLIAVLKETGIATKRDLDTAIEASEKRLRRDIDTAVKTSEERLREVTKKDTAEAIKASEKRLKKHFSDGITRIAKDIIATSETLHNEVVGRLDDLELNTVKRGEFEALKRKVERYHPAS